MPPGQGKSKSAARRRARRERGGIQAKDNGKMVSVKTSGPTTNVLLQKKSAGRRTMGNSLMSKMSVPGELFLKSSFASPDFAQQNKFMGIPDNIANPILPVSFTHTSDLGIFVKQCDFDWPMKPAQRLAVIQLPIPGMAFYLAQSDNNGNFGSGERAVRGVSYEQYAALFGQPYDFNVDKMSSMNFACDKFRISANALELVCTSNAMTWQGSIRCFRLPVTMTTSGAAYDTGVFEKSSGTNIVSNIYLEGLQGVRSTTVPAFVSPSNLGAYMVGVNMEARFQEQPIQILAANVITGKISQDFVIYGQFPGFSELTTNVMMLEGTSTQTVPTNFQIRTWQSVEVMPTTSGGGLSEYSSLLPILSIPSPELDPVALMVYKEVAERLPIAVTYEENEGFWDDVMGVIKTVGSVAGTVAQIAGILGALL